MVSAPPFHRQLQLFGGGSGDRDHAALFLPACLWIGGLALLEFKDLVRGVPPSGRHLQKPFEFSVAAFHSMSPLTLEAIVYFPMMA